MPTPRPAPPRRSIGSSARGLEAPPGLRWVLLGAFGEPGAPGAAPPEPEAAAALAVTLGLFQRVVHRLGPERLAADLGAEAAGAALGSYRRSALASAKLVALARLVGRVAARSGLRVVALKHAALCLSGIVSPAGRGAVDADLLVSDRDAPRLAAALAREGFREHDVPGHGHQHRALVHPRAGMLELHRYLPGVRPLADGPQAGLEALVAHGLVRPVDAAEPGLLLPHAPVLLGHALAHALYQHGLEPRAHAPLRLLADAADLRAVAGAALIESALPLVAAEVSEEDARAAWALPPLLAAGGLDAAFAEPGSPEARLLAHFLRGALDPGYPASLKLRNLATLPADRGGPAGLLRKSWHALAIGPARARALYGADSRPKYLLALAARPFHLAWKLVRYAAAALRR